MPLGQHGPSVTLGDHLQLLADIEKLEELLNNLQFSSYDEATDEVIIRLS